MSFQYLVCRMTCDLFFTSHNTCQLLNCVCQLMCIILFFWCDFLRVKINKLAKLCQTYTLVPRQHIKYMSLNTNVWPTTNIWHIKSNATLNQMPIYRLRGRQLRDSDLRSNEVRGSTRTNRTWANVSFGNADRRRCRSLPLPRNEEPSSSPFLLSSNWENRRHCFLFLS